ncbi:hypothetical protein MACJ_003949 [Theileria orientalis]|uniref:Uncharacterized protein n=1 Tax=Theileria orientalis TaxID=68886 RepID=A0A976SKT6_THEOR|nr:hypothetical protein MACJ_003949 [Theileria orientalis]
MDKNFEFRNPNNGFTNFNNNDTHNLNFSFNSTDDLTHLGKLKNELRESLEFLETKMKTEPTNNQEWQTLLDLKNSIKTKLNSANPQLNQLLKQNSLNVNGVKYVQIQRYSSIFDQLTSEFNNVSKQLDSKYQRFVLFSSPSQYYTENEKSTKVFYSNKGVVEAIKDVESLEDQAKMNLEMIKRGNRRLLKAYNRVNTMINKHLVDVSKLQKSIAYVMARNRMIFAIIIGIFLFFVLYKIFSLFS